MGVGEVRAHTKAGTGLGPTRERASAELRTTTVLDMWVAGGWGPGAARVFYLLETEMYFSFDACMTCKLIEAQRVIFPCAVHMYVSHSSRRSSQVAGSGRSSTVEWSGVRAACSTSGRILGQRPDVDVCIGSIRSTF